MIKIDVQRNLIGLEDLLVGIGTVQQVRGPNGTAPITITEINGANFPYDATFSMSDKIDSLQNQMDTLPEVVDQNGDLLTGLINTSATDLDLVNRLWRKTIDATTAELYYFDELLFQYDPTNGNIHIPGGTDYIAADVVVTSAFQTADSVLQGLIDTLNLDTLNIQGLAVGTAALNLVQLDATGKLPAVDGSLLTGIVHPDSNPIGTILTVPYTTPDTNYNECNGVALDRIIHATLFAKIGTTFGAGDGSTTFNLPDYRGEFLRGWDNTRGVDIGRVIGTFQSDELKAHNHTSSATTSSSTIEEHGDSGDARITARAGSATGSTGGVETRPRNSAVMYQIKVL